MLSGYAHLSHVAAFWKAVERVTRCWNPHQTVTNERRSQGPRA
jgi:hypothetical protein